MCTCTHTEREEERETESTCFFLFQQQTDHLLRAINLEMHYH